MSQSPSETLGRYQIIREIARSNDIVYEAYDPAMHRRLAVKELALPSTSTDQQREDRLRRFEREARAAGSLVHPNIVTVYEVGRDGDRHFIAMEYLDGSNLREELDRKGMFEADRAVKIARDVLAALGFAHKNGVVHRDVKPDNVQLLSNGSVKVTDFGIARLTFEPNLTVDGQVFGTPSYMSPEQIHGKDIDARSDLFGVGVLLYEMISGTKPFQGDNVVAITYAIMNKEPDRIASASDPLWQAIRKAIAKTPQERYADAQAMADAIEAAVRAPAEPHNPFLPNADPQAGMRYGVNPYVGASPQQQQPIQTPYGQPVQPAQPQPQAPPQQIPVPQPIQTPYGQQPQQPMSYPQPGQPLRTPYGPQPGRRVPIQYPSAPKPPLMTDDQKRGMARGCGISAAIVLVLLLIALIPSAIENVRENLPEGNADVQPTPVPIEANANPEFVIEVPPQEEVPVATTNELRRQAVAIMQRASQARWPKDAFADVEAANALWLEALALSNSAEEQQIIYEEGSAHMLFAAQSFWNNRLDFEAAQSAQFAQGLAPPGTANHDAVRQFLFEIGRG